MVWHLIKYWISFLLPTFYKRIQGKNIHLLKVRGPAIIAMNHPNAFTDPILFTYVAYPVRTYYLARGDAFKPGLISWILEKIGIVPIFRIQDGGKEGLKKNDEAYRRVNHLLGKHSKIIVFAEGLCVQERRLRPLKKGVARMVFGAYTALNDDRLMVYPVGVNYSQPDKFRSDLFYNVGEPIPVKDFIPLYQENPAKANNAFLQVLESKMKGLVTHINDRNYDETVYMAETLYKRELLNTRGLNPKDLSDDFVALTEITEKVNRGVIERTALVDEFTVKATAYFNELKRLKIRDWLIDPNQNRQVNYLALVGRGIILLACFPLHALGLLGNYIPLRVTDKLARKIARNREFYSSMAIGFAMFIFLINYLLWFFLSRFFFTNSLWPLIICLILAISGWASLYYHPFLKKTLGMARVLRNKTTAKDLLQTRNYLIDLINKF